MKTHQSYPTGVPEEINARCVSVDGDADRVIYYYIDESNKFHLLDGDRIATLIAGYLKEILEETHVELSLGLVQTAYANGASTDYIKNKLVSNIAINFGIYIYYYEFSASACCMCAYWYQTSSS